MPLPWICPLWKRFFSARGQTTTMNAESVVYWISIAGAVCWAVCFLVMYRISNNQNIVLRELREQAARIEELSREEHDLIKEVHPQVGKIKNDLSAVARNLNAER